MHLLAGMALGAGVGLFVATIGAWKDVQWEPFSWLTFMRSPLVTASWGAVLGGIFVNAPLVLVALAAAACERVTVESWKGIFRKMPSKFKSKARDTGWLRRLFLGEYE